MPDCNTCPYGKWTAAAEMQSSCVLIPTPAPTPVPTPVPTPAPTPIQNCSHVTCSMVNDGTEANPNPVMQIRHSSDEQNGVNHRCGNNVVTQACTCTCFMNEHYSLMPGLGNELNFGIASPAPTPRALIYTQSMDLTISYFYATHASANLWETAMRFEFADYVGVKPSQVVMSNSRDLATAGQILTGLGPAGYPEPIFAPHPGAGFTLTITGDLSTAKVNMIKAQCEHLKNNVDAMVSFKDQFEARLRTSAYPAADIVADYSVWAGDIVQTQVQNDEYWFGKCLAGFYPYHSDIVSKVECLPCPEGTDSKAGAKECFLKA